MISDLKLSLSLSKNLFSTKGLSPGEPEGHLFLLSHEA